MTSITASELHKWQAAFKQMGCRAGIHVYVSDFGFAVEVIDAETQTRIAHGTEPHLEQVLETALNICKARLLLAGKKVPAPTPKHDDTLDATLMWLAHEAGMKKQREAEKYRLAQMMYRPPSREDYVRAQSKLAADHSLVPSRPGLLESRRAPQGVDASPAQSPAKE